MPKKTIYITDADQQVWEQAEALAIKESLSGLLKRRRALRVTVRLEKAHMELHVRVEPTSGGWLINVPENAMSDQSRPTDASA